MPANNESLGEVGESVESLEGTVDSSGPHDESETGGPTQEMAENWLTTGIKDLDRYLSGGLPPGRLIAFEAPTDTQSELFVQQLASEHDSLFLSSLRPGWEVEETVRDHVQRKSQVGDTKVNTKVEYLEPGSRLRQAQEYLDAMSERSIVVIDSADELENEAESHYVDFLDKLKRRLWKTASVGLLHCFERDREQSGRRITLRMADIIWQLRRTVRVSDVEYLLVVSKVRGGHALNEPVKLELTHDVRVDTSRDIA